ncbi:MAG: hypothetical protein ABEK17_02435 [Candidatus Aenigmatarchaeota archaeon]
MSEPVISPYDVYSKLEFGKFSKEAALYNISQTFEYVCPIPVDFTKMKSADIQI